MNDTIWSAALHLLTPLFAAHCASHHLPGCAFGVVAGGRLAAAGGVGVVDPLAGGAPNAHIVYRIASMSKSFGALAILMLRDAGMLRLDAPAADYVPELRGLAYPTKDSAPVTVRQLLTMAGGWPEDNAWGDRQLGRSNAWLGELLSAGVSFANAPGVAFEYSNLGYMVLGRIIANVAGEPALDFITHRILQPLDMCDTVWDADDVDPARMAKGYRWLDGGWVAEPMLPSGGDGAVFGALYSSVADMSRWVALMLWAWPPRDEPDDGIVRRATLRELQQPWRLYRPSNVPPALGEPVTWSAGGYGFGLRTNYDGQVTSVAHAGGLPGFGSHMCWLPDHNVGIVALGNVRNADMSEAGTAALFELLRQGHVRPRPLAASSALEQARDDVNGLLEMWDDTLADRLFADNFFLDDSRSQRQAEMAQLRARHGALHDGGPLEPENALRGTWKLQGKRGFVNAFLTLTPTMPPRVQELGFESVLPPGPALEAALASLVKLLNRPSRRETEKQFTLNNETAPAAHTMYDIVRLVSIVCGPCKLGRVSGGDGDHWVRLLIEGTKGTVEAEITLDEQRRRIARAVFRHVQ